MAGGYYTLDSEHRPVPCSLVEWSRLFGDDHNRRVGLTETKLYQVSTVFLGLDHRFSGKGPPILFETMVFDLYPTVSMKFGNITLVRDDVECSRYSSWDDAETMHHTIVGRLLREEAESADEIQRELENLNAK